MTIQQIATALQRVEAVLHRRPESGLHDDPPATARWEGGTRVVSSHANGTQMATDMPCELGGSGNGVSPGWLFRAGIAACTATRIAMGAAAAGIDLAALEVRTSSRTDTRGLLGMADADGAAVDATPVDMQLVVRIRAHGVDPSRLRSLVEEGYRCSPMAGAVRNVVPVDLQIQVEAA